jgi:hypothetical protein
MKSAPSFFLVLFLQKEFPETDRLLFVRQNHFRQHSGLQAPAVPAALTPATVFHRNGALVAELAAEGGNAGGLVGAPENKI